MRAGVLVLVACTACGQPDNTNNGGDDVPDAGPADGDNGDAGGDGGDGGDGGPSEVCAAAPTGALVRGEAINVPGRIQAVAVTPDNHRTFVGAYNTAQAFSLDFAGTPAPNADGLDGFIWRRDAAGTTQWLVTFTGTGDRDRVMTVVDDGTSIYVTGRTSGTMLGTVAIDAGASPYVEFVAKLSAADGATEWVRTFPGPTSNSLAPLNDTVCSLQALGTELFVTCGFRGGPISFVADGNVTTTVQNVGTRASLLVRIDPTDGEALEQFLISAPAGDNAGQVTSRLAIAADGTLVLVGTYSRGSLSVKNLSTQAEAAGPPTAPNGLLGYYARIDGPTRTPFNVLPIQNGAGGGPADMQILATSDHLYVTGLSTQGLHFGAGGDLETDDGFLVAINAAPVPDSIDFLHALPSSRNAPIRDACGRLLLTASASLVPDTADGIAIPSFTGGVLAVSPTDGTATAYASVKPCVGDGAACDPRNTVEDLAATPTGGAIVVGGFNSQIDFGDGNGPAGFGGGQPFIAEYAR